MPSSTRVTQNMTVNGVDQLRRAFATIDTAATKTLRAACKEIAAGTAEAARVRAAGVSAQAGLAGSSVKASAGTTPTVRFGGARRVGRRRNPVGAFAFGAEFGGGRRNGTAQFPRWRGSGHSAGYFLWPTIRARKAHDLRVYNAALDKVCRQWARGD